MERTVNPVPPTLILRVGEVAIASLTLSVNQGLLPLDVAFVAPEVLPFSLDLLIVVHTDFEGVLTKFADPDHVSK